MDTLCILELGWNRVFLGWEPQKRVASSRSRAYSRRTLAWCGNHSTVTTLPPSELIIWGLILTGLFWYILLWYPDQMQAAPPWAQATFQHVYLGEDGVGIMVPHSTRLCFETEHDFYGMAGGGHCHERTHWICGHQTGWWYHVSAVAWTQV